MRFKSDLTEPKMPQNKTIFKDVEEVEVRKYHNATRVLFINYFVSNQRKARKKYQQSYGLPGIMLNNRKPKTLFSSIISLKYTFIIFLKIIYSFPTNLNFSFYMRYFILHFIRLHLFSKKYIH